MSDFFKKIPNFKVQIVNFSTPPRPPLLRAHKKIGFFLVKSLVFYYIKKSMQTKIYSIKLYEVVKKLHGFIIQDWLDARQKKKITNEKVKSQFLRSAHTKCV